MDQVHQAGKMLRRTLAGYAQKQTGCPLETERDAMAIRGSAEWVRSLFPGWVVMVCLVQHPSVPYISANCEQVLGYTARELTCMSPEASFRLIHPQDIAAVRSAFTYMHRFTSQSGYNPTHYRFVFHYRFCQPGGQYVYLCDEKLAIENHYNRQVFFTLFHQPACLARFRQVKLEIYQHHPKGLVKLTEYVPRTPAEEITVREQKMVQLISTGLSNKQISEALSISLNTVKTHRNRLFRKLNVHNRTQLLQLAQQKSWIE